MERTYYQFDIEAHDLTMRQFRKDGIETARALLVSRPWYANSDFPEGELCEDYATLLRRIEDLQDAQGLRDFELPSFREIGGVPRKLTDMTMAVNGTLAGDYLVAHRQFPEGYHLRRLTVEQALKKAAQQASQSHFRVVSGGFLIEPGENVHLFKLPDTFVVNNQSELVALDQAGNIMNIDTNTNAERIACLQETFQDPRTAELMRLAFRSIDAEIRVPENGFAEQNLMLVAMAGPDLSVLRQVGERLGYGVLVPSSIKITGSKKIDLIRTLAS